MKSLRELYRIGLGPSSSHTMGPRFAAQAFRASLPAAVARIRVNLYGSLAATGSGHLTDVAVSEPFSPLPVEIVWLPESLLPLHTNGMQFEALDEAGHVVASHIARRGRRTGWRRNHLSFFQHAGNPCADRA